MARLVTFDEGRVGRVDDGEVAVLDVRTMRAYYEQGGAQETGERLALGDVKLRAPIIPKKFLHTAGNFREHEEESKRVDWSHEIAPWIVFFQNVDAIVGPDEPVVYPEHLTQELDYALELALVVSKAGTWFGAWEAAGYIAGDVFSTGTVSGVPGFSEDAASLYLKPGDVIEAEIERIGVLRNPVVAWSDAHA